MSNKTNMLTAGDAQLSTHLFCASLPGDWQLSLQWPPISPREKAARVPKETLLRTAPLRLRAARAHSPFKWTNNRAMGGLSRTNKQRGHCGVCGGLSGFKRLRTGPSDLTRRRWVAGGPDPPSQAPGSGRRARGGSLNPGRGVSMDARSVAPRTRQVWRGESGRRPETRGWQGGGAWALRCGPGRGWDPGYRSAPGRDADDSVRGMRKALGRAWPRLAAEGVPGLGRGPCEMALLSCPSRNC